MPDVVLGRMSSQKTQMRRTEMFDLSGFFAGIQSLLDQVFGAFSGLVTAFLAIFGIQA